MQTAKVLKNDNVKNEDFDLKVQDNKAKDALLYKKYGQDIECFNYFFEIFNDDKVLFVQCASDVNKRFFAEDELINIFINNYDLQQTYCHYCSFIKNYKSENTINDIYAFCIDLDNVNANDLYKLIYNKFKYTIKPTYIVNSGNGIHLIYLLKQPFQLLHRYKKTINKIKDNLQNQFCYKNNEYSYVVDKHPVSQPYRIPGLYNKLGRQVKVWESGKKYSIEQLANSFKLKLYTNNKTNNNNKTKKTDNKNIMYLPNAKKGLYKWALDRLYLSNVGRRYNTMCVVVVCGWKCRVSYKDIKKDLIEYIRTWNESLNKDIMQLREADKALTLYNPKSTLCSKRKLSEWLGYEIKPAKRNGRKQKEHLILASKQSAQARASKKYIVIMGHLLTNKNYSLNQLVELTGFGKATVCKYAKQVRAENPLLQKS